MSTLSLPLDLKFYQRRARVRDRVRVAHQVPLAVRVTKRCIDVVAAIIGLLAVAILFPLLMLAIYVDSPGPLFYRQRRAAGIRSQARGGFTFVEFDMLKFRTMRPDAEKYTGAVLAGEDDPRVTRVGRYLRKTRLDELPQLWNVLRGEMSLVGPRPPIPSEVALYAEQHYTRFDVRPGITGPWQVNGRNKITDFEDVIRLETDYIRHWTIWKDLEILLRTLPAVVRMDGAH